MNKNEIFKDGKLLEYTTEEVINNTVYFKHYDAQDNLLNEWTEDAPPPQPKSELEELKELVAQLQAQLDGGGIV